MQPERRRELGTQRRSQRAPTHLDLDVAAREVGDDVEAAGGDDGVVQRRDDDREITAIDDAIEDGRQVAADRRGALGLSGAWSVSSASRSSTRAWRNPSALMRTAAP